MNRIPVMTDSRNGLPYAALQTETGFLFHRMRDDEIFYLSVFDRSPKDIVIDHDQIRSKRLTMFSEIQYGACGKILLYTQDQTCHEFYIIGKHPIPELRCFFGLTDDQIQLPEQDLAYGKSLPRSEKNEGVHLWLYLLCWALDLGMLLGAVFLPYRAWLIWGLAALLTPVALALLFPAWYTLTRLENDSGRVYGKHMLRLMMPLYVPPILLLLRLPQITYLPGTRVFFTAALPAALLSIVVWILSPERKAASNALAAVLAFWTIAGCSVGLAVNAADYYCNPPSRIETCPISALERDSNVSAQPCYVTASTDDGELKFHIEHEAYERLSVGDPIKVSFYDGTLGTPFACLYEGG